MSQVDLNSQENVGRHPKGATVKNLSMKFAWVQEGADPFNDTQDIPSDTPCDLFFLLTFEAEVASEGDGVTDVALQEITEIESIKVANPLGGANLYTQAFNDGGRVGNQSEDAFSVFVMNDSLWHGDATHPQHLNLEFNCVTQYFQKFTRPDHTVEIQRRQTLLTRRAGAMITAPPIVTHKPILAHQPPAVPTSPTPAVAAGNH